MPISKPITTTLIRGRISEISWNEVRDFCKKGYPEGIQLDYKKDYPEKGLTRIVASMANTAGGIIIIGVEIDKKGQPVKMEGVKDAAQLIERFNQEVGNISPQVKYEIERIDNEDSTHSFVVARIFEGDYPPYHIFNDSRVWIRTGDVNKPFALASPEWLNYLLQKREKAILARANSLQIAREYFRVGLEEEEIERQRLIADAEKSDRDPNEYYQQKLGTKTSMCEMIIMPFFPGQQLASPKEIKNEIPGLREPLGYFPRLNFRPIQGGIMSFHHAYNGYIDCQQIHSDGTTYYTLDVLSQDEQGDDCIYLSQLFVEFMRLLYVANKFYKHFGFVGNLRGHVALQKTKGLRIMPVTQGPTFRSDVRKIFRERYSWELKLDTSIISNPIALKDYAIEFTNEISWSLGFETINSSAIEELFKQKKLIDDQ